MSGTDPTGVTITAREIYDAVVKLIGRVDVLIGQHDSTRDDVADHEKRLRVLEQTRAIAADVEQRLRVLESARWPLPAVSVLVALAALIVSFVR